MNQIVMNQIVIDRLFESFSELEKAIRQAKLSLAKRENAPTDLLGRIECYDEILAKQRALANNLTKFVAEQNWLEVERHVKLINNLSWMIRDDAKEVAEGLKTPLSQEQRELMLS